MSAAGELAMDEAEWQQQFLDAAHAYAWQHMHVRRSIGKGKKWTTATNVKGWPDLTLWNLRQQRVAFVELKSEDGIVSPDQQRVLSSLAAAGCDVKVWRPSQLDEVHAWLKPAKTGARGAE